MKLGFSDSPPLFLCIYILNRNPVLSLASEAESIKKHYTNIAAQKANDDLILSTLRSSF